jgi:tetratricopeptide (TPR) repeat protein|tara:strand:- start:307 stop:1902 length:1596 start_codon:yes stop_codon:yes gene_type:complete
MLKRILFSTIICLFAFVQNTNASISDSTYFSHLKAYSWQPISDVDKVLQHEKAKELSKRTLDQSKLADQHYSSGIDKMNSKDYSGAIIEFKAAMKRYKRAKLSDNALNYLRINMSLSYAHTGNKKDIIAAKRYLNLVTSKVDGEENWLYNIAIAKNKIGDQVEATKLLSSIIKKNDGNFQAYVTLAEIYKDSGNEDEAEKVKDRMQKVEDKLNQQKQKNKSKQASKPRSVKAKKKTKAKKIVLNPKGVKPDVTNLKISKNDDPLQFNKIDKIDDRSMVQIQAGISEFNAGVKALSEKDYGAAQNKLKEAEKRLKRGKVSEDGLNFSRGNLAIALLASGEKRGVGQAKRYLINLTPKIYKNRDWAYNMGVAHYNFGSRSKGATQKDFYKKSAQLFRSAIQLDKLFLTAYENLVYVYIEMGEDAKALKTYKAFIKSRDRLLNSFSKEEQAKLGLGVPYVFRVRLGTYGVFNAPIELYDQEYLITVPLSNTKTTFLAGIFYNLKDAQAYLEKMQKNGFESASIVAFKDGEKTEF